MSIYIEDIIKKAESGDEKAQFDLALAYCEGHGVECNYEKTYNLYIELAEKRVPAAMFGLGRMFVYGIGREVDIANAMHWFWKAYRHNYDSLNAINYIRLNFANDYLSTKPGTISDTHIREIAEYIKKKYAIIDCYIENCQKQEVIHPYKFVDVDSINKDRIFYLNTYPYPTSVNQNGFKEYLCSIILRRRALDLLDIDYDRANAYLDTSYEVIKNIPEAWVADSYMDYCELKGKFYMKQENWEEAIITFTDILKYRNSCDLSQYPKDDENIKEKLSEDELEHLKKAEYSFYDAYVSLIECYFKQNMIYDAEESSCNLYEILNERTDSWAIDWILGEIEKEYDNSKQPNLIDILKKLGTQHIGWYCNALYGVIIKKVISKNYNWSKKQCELIEAMFNLAIPYFEQKKGNYDDKEILTNLYIYKGEYMVQNRQLDEAKGLFLKALLLSNELLLSKDIGNKLGILEIRLYQVLNPNIDNQYYQWGYIFFMYRRLLSGKIYGTKRFFEP